MKKLIVAVMLIISSNVFADVYSDNEQRKYNQDMLAQQQEQNRLLQEQNAQMQMQQQNEANRNSDFRRNNNKPNWSTY